MRNANLKQAARKPGSSESPSAVQYGASTRAYLVMRRKMQAGFGIAVLSLLLVGAMSYSSIARLVEYNTWVDHTNEVIDGLDALLAATAEAESAQRGYAISGKEIFLDANRQANDSAHGTLARLYALTADDPLQRQRLSAVSELLEQRIQVNDAAIELRRSEGFEAVQKRINSDQDRQLQSQLRAAVNAVRDAEQELLVTRKRQSTQNANITKATVISGGVLAFGVIGWALVALRRDFAGRQRAEAELDRFFSLSLDFLCISSADGYFKRVSPAVTDMLGWGVAEFLARPYLSYVHPDDHEATLREVEKQVKQGEKVFHFENRYRHKDGSWRVLSWRSMPQPEGLMYATARDVTDLKQNELALRESKEQLEQRVQERTADLLRTTQSLEKEIAQHSDSQHRLHAQLERLGLLQQITRGIAERLDNKSIFAVVIRALEAQLPVDFACICLFDAAANQLVVNSIGKGRGDMARELCLQEEDRIELEQSGLARCAEGLLVYDPDIGAAPQGFLANMANCKLHALVAVPMNIEHKFFGCLLVARRQADCFDSGEREFLRQLSEHVALAAHQAQLYGALQAAYEDLRQTQQAVMQQERLRVLGQMASGIAHDINNAITPVSIYTNVLLRKEPNLSERARGFLQTIQQSISDVAETVARMREFYRPRDSQALVPVEMNKLILQVVDLTRVRWSDMPQQRGVVIDMRTELADELPLIMGVESEIREALTNLVFNAVDAMPGGGVLTLRTSVTSDAMAEQDHAASGRYVHVEVADTGTGMDEETRRRCLELFFTTKGERGTGLGLAMVYGTVQRHGGEIDITSEPGKGTCVRLSFVAMVADTHEQSAMAMQPLRELRILVVDDDAVLLKSLSELLRSEGHVVTAASGGQEGINAFVAANELGSDFDVVITDLGMPFVDGSEVAGAVKAASPNTPVILLTGWGHRLLTEGGVPPYVDRVLPKPPKPLDLHAALVELTAKQTAELQ